MKVVHVNRAALELRIRPGQTLADASAIVTSLVTCDDDPAADRRLMETLAVWGDCLSPTVHIEGDDTLILDVTGCERLFGGEGKLLQADCAVRLPCMSFPLQKATDCTNLPEPP